MKSREQKKQEKAAAWLQDQGTSHPYNDFQKKLEAFDPNVKKSWEELDNARQLLVQYTPKNKSGTELPPKKLHPAILNLAGSLLQETMMTTLPNKVNALIEKNIKQGHLNAPLTELKQVMADQNPDAMKEFRKNLKKNTEVPDIAKEVIDRMLGTSIREIEETPAPEPASKPEEKKRPTPIDDFKNRNCNWCVGSFTISGVAALSILVVEAGYVQNKELAAGASALLGFATGVLLSSAAKGAAFLGARDKEQPSLPYIRASIGSGLSLGITLASGASVLGGAFQAGFIAGVAFKEALSLKAMCGIKNQQDEIRKQQAATQQPGA